MSPRTIPLGWRAHLLPSSWYPSPPPACSQPFGPGGFLSSPPAATPQPKRALICPPHHAGDVIPIFWLILADFGHPVQAEQQLRGWGLMGLHHRGSLPGGCCHAWGCPGVCCHIMPPCHHWLCPEGPHRWVPAPSGCLKPQPRGVCPRHTQPHGLHRSVTETRAWRRRTFPQLPAPYGAILGST